MKLNGSWNSRVAISAVAFAAAVFAVPTVAMSDRSALPGAESVLPATSSVAVEKLAPVAAAVVEATAASIFTAEAWQDVTLGGIDPKLFAMALNAAASAVATGDAAEPRTLTVIDFSKPSTLKRMWVFDLRSKELLFEELVSHGRGSGRTMATEFSNVPESNQSSIGLYRTGETYIGKHGYSLRLDGLEPGFNDRARARAIVMHGAEYVNESTARAQGYLGRSLGCPALRPGITREVIDAVKEGGLLFAYYPDPQWLSTSKFVD